MEMGQWKHGDEFVIDNPHHTGFWTFPSLREDPRSLHLVVEPETRKFTTFGSSGQSSEIQRQSSAAQWLKLCLGSQQSQRELAIKIVRTYGAIVKKLPHQTMLQVLQMVISPIDLGLCGQLKLDSVIQGKLSALTQIDPSKPIMITISPPAGSPPSRLPYPRVSSEVVLSSGTQAFAGWTIDEIDQFSLARERDIEIMKWLSRVQISLQQDQHSLVLGFVLD